MYNRMWKYKVRKGPDGKRRFYARVEDTMVEVSYEVFRCLDKADAHEEYSKRRNAERGDTYIEYIKKKAGPDIAGALAPVESAEDTYLKKETKLMKRHILQFVPVLVHRLPDDEKDILRSLYYKGMSLRKYAGERGISMRQAKKRKDLALYDLREKLVLTFGNAIDGSELFAAGAAV